MIVPRQDGKGAVLEARQLFGLFRVEGERTIIHTAHEFKTATESFLRLAALVEDTPALNAQVRDIYYANGKESIVLKNGKRVKFLARSGKSGRGFTSDLLIFDEAMDLPQATVGASGPTQSARPNPQTVYTATAGNADSQVLAQLREDGIAGAGRLAYVEYSAGDPDDHVGDQVDLDDRDQWFQANPAMWGDNPRMTVEAVETDRAMMDDENFARERLCLWWVNKRVAVIDADQFLGLIREGNHGSDVVFAFDMNPERDSADIAVGSVMPDGRKLLELVEHRPGTGWLVDRVKELDQKWLPGHWAVQPTSPAGARVAEVKEALEENRVPIFPISGIDLAAACGLIFDDIQNGRIVIHPNHTAELVAAVDAVRKRELVDGGFVWNRRDTAANIAPFMALTLANYALMKKPATRRKRRTQNPF